MQVSSIAREGATHRALQTGLNAEKVAYWYLRLNGFLQIENFVVHPARRGSQRTDADLLAVRFPYRAEFLLDHPGSPMQDDAGLSLSSELIDVVIAEVKTNRPCTLNGPWTREDRQNVHRILAAIGCIPPERIGEAAHHIYRTGIYQDVSAIRVRLVAIGRERNNEVAASYPEATQVLWTDLLTFMWDRFRTYRQQKTQVEQWDTGGRRIKSLADKSHDSAEFVDCALRLMGVRSQHGID